MADEQTPVCALCRRKEPATVCTRCKDRARERLDALPDLYRRLELALIRVQGVGPKVSGSKRSAPLPLSAPVLSLISAGAYSDQVRETFVPLIRTWTTRERVTVYERDPDGGPPIPMRKEVTRWHREVARDPNGRPVLVPAGDQDGYLPVAMWLTQHEADWRARFGHDPTTYRPPPPVHAGPGAVVADPSMYLRLLNTDDTWREHPLPPGVAGPVGPRRPMLRPKDPVDAELRARFGVPAFDDAVATAVAYLGVTLDWACEQHPDAVWFLTQLRAVHGACRAAVGELDSDVYLGQCPEPNGATPCGAALVVDPYVDWIVCPRCKTETGKRKWLWLAQRIRETWPDAPGRDTWAKMVSTGGQGGG